MVCGWIMGQRSCATALALSPSRMALAHGLRVSMNAFCAGTGDYPVPAPVHPSPPQHLISSWDMTPQNASNQPVTARPKPS